MECHGCKGSSLICQLTTLWCLQFPISGRPSSLKAALGVAFQTVTKYLLIGQCGTQVIPTGFVVFTWIHEIVASRERPCKGFTPRPKCDFFVLKQVGNADRSGKNEVTYKSQLNGPKTQNPKASPNSHLFYLRGHSTDRRLVDTCFCRCHKDWAPQAWKDTRVYPVSSYRRIQLDCPPERVM